jgi:hypothetical protein
LAAGVVDTSGKFATNINNTRETGGKFAAGVVDTGGNLPPVSFKPVANLLPVSLIPVVHLDLNREFPKKFEKLLM